MTLGSVTSLIHNPPLSEPDINSKLLLPLVGLVLSRHNIKCRPKDNLPVILCFLDTLKNIIPRLVQTLLIGNLVHNPLGRPASRSLLDRADIQNSVVQVSHHTLVGLSPQKRPVAVHAVACEEATLTLGDKSRDVLVEGIGGLLWSSRRLKNSGGEARFCVCLCAPLIHLVKTRLGEVDDGVKALFVENLKVSRCDDAVDLYDFIIVLVETSHLLIESA
ncbi:hypothetical protein HG531_002440 [Fusarium graminearum]|nr:hypothetical protein HG531_002440 [Fusarium graminearum]